MNILNFILNEHKVVHHHMPRGSSCDRGLLFLAFNMYTTVDLYVGDLMHRGLKMKWAWRLLLEQFTWIGRLIRRAITLLLACHSGITSWYYSDVRIKRLNSNVQMTQAVNQSGSRALRIQLYRYHLGENHFKIRQLYKDHNKIPLCAQKVSLS